MDSKKELKEKLKNIRKKLSIESKKEFFRNVFGKGFIDYVMIEDFKYPAINEIISLMESTKIPEIDYRALPTYVLQEDNERYIEIFKTFFLEDRVYIMYSYIIDFDVAIAGYIHVLTESFIENFDRLRKPNGFIVTDDFKKFAYYNQSSCEDFANTYVYLGEIHNERYIKILNENKSDL